MKSKPPFDIPAVGPDWYCPHCDKFVAHIDTRAGHHDEAKGGCGNILQTCKFDPAQAPRDWSHQPPQPE